MPDSSSEKLLHAHTSSDLPGHSPRHSPRLSTHSPGFSSASSPVYVSRPGSREGSRPPSPPASRAFEAESERRRGGSGAALLQQKRGQAYHDEGSEHSLGVDGRSQAVDRGHSAYDSHSSRLAAGDDYSESDADDADQDQDPAMPSDLRPPFNRPNDGRSQDPLLSSSKAERGYDSSQASLLRPAAPRRKSTFRERDPEASARAATRKRYTYAAFFLVVSLIAFAVQTETAVYIQHYLHWNKAYAMLYFTHGSWSCLWFVQLAILRLQKRDMPWSTFWRRHVQILRQTAQMVEHNDLHAPQKYPNQSPVPYILRTVAFVTCALTVAGGSWYLAVDMTTASDLTAIYNCSAFFAYAFSVPILKERLRWSKAIAVGIAIVGVIIVAYGDAGAKHGNKSGGGSGKRPPTDDNDADGSDDDGASKNRALGNIVIGVGSVLYGFYEVLYKRFACPPEETSPGRAMIFANAFGTCIGLFTLTVLWIPLPILHYTGIEVFEWPRGEAAWMLAISTLSNAVFSGCFLVLISLTSPVLSSVAALLTIFIVALIDQLLPPPLKSNLSGAAIAGGLLIIGAFLMLSWATYKEMDEERRKKAEDVVDDSDVESVA